MQVINYNKCAHNYALRVSTPAQQRAYYHYCGILLGPLVSAKTLLSHVYICIPYFLKWQQSLQHLNICKNGCFAVGAVKLAANTPNCILRVIVCARKCNFTWISKCGQGTIFFLYILKQTFEIQLILFYVICSEKQLNLLFQMILSLNFEKNSI